MIMSYENFAYCKKGKVWQKAFLSYPDRAVGDIIDNDESKSLDFYAANFQQITEKLAVLENEINTNTNKGSYLVKLQYLKDTFIQAPAIGDYEHVYNTLNKYETEINELVNANRERNLAIKQALIEEAKVAIENPDWKAVTEQLKEIRSKWIKTGAVRKELEDETNERFKDLVDGFFEKKKTFYDDKQRMFESRLEGYIALVEKARAIAQANKPSASYEFKKLKEEWKKVGIVPKEKLEPLMKEFKELKKKFTVKKPFTPSGNRFQKPASTSSSSTPSYAPVVRKPLNNPEALQDNYFKKQELVEIAKKLAFSPTDATTHTRIEKLKADWKTIGPVDKKLSNMQWENFITLCDRASELAYLEHVMIKKFGKNFTDPTEKLKRKIEYLRESIGADKNEIRVYEENQAKFSGNTFNQLIDNKILNRKRKLATKEQLLQEMMDSLK